MLSAARSAEKESNLFTKMPSDHYMEVASLLLNKCVLLPYMVCNMCLYFWSCVYVVVGELWPVNTIVIQCMYCIHGHVSMVTACNLPWLPYICSCGYHNVYLVTWSRWPLEHETGRKYHWIGNAYEALFMRLHIRMYSTYSNVFIYTVGLLHVSLVHPQPYCTSEHFYGPNCLYWKLHVTKTLRHAYITRFRS